MKEGALPMIIVLLICLTVCYLFRNAGCKDKASKDQACETIISQRADAIELGRYQLLPAIDSLLVRFCSCDSIPKTDSTK